MPKKVSVGIAGKLDILVVNPEYGKALRGELTGYRSVRIGRHRIVYRYVPAADIVWVLAVGIRKQGATADIYEKLVKLARSGGLEPE